jgi:hypothetical protein
MFQTHIIEFSSLLASLGSPACALGLFDRQFRVEITSEYLDDLTDGRMRMRMTG